MANYSLVIGSRFSPFTYQELLQPAMMATQAHQDLENQYAELATKASIWDKLANEQTDTYAHDMYKAYSEDLEKQANQLAREGLTPKSRQGLLQMKKRYSEDILPIEQAYKRRQELVDEQRKLQTHDNTMMFDRNASTLKLEDLIKNPQLSYNSYSGALLAKQVGEAAKNLSRDMRDNPVKWRSILNNQYYESLKQTGFSPEEIIRVIQNSKKASPILRGIVEDAIKSSGISNWGSPEALNRAFEYANQGLWNAIGETKYDTLINRNHNADAGDNDGNGGNGDTEDTNIYYTTVPRTTVDADINTSSINEDLKTLQELMENPNLVYSSNTRKVPRVEYDYGDPGIQKSAAKTTYIDETYYPYAEKLEELGKKYGIVFNLKDGIMTESNLGEVAQQLTDSIRSSAIRDFVYKPNITQTDLITEVLKRNARTSSRRGSTGLYELDEDGKKGESISKEDLSKYFTNDSDVDYDINSGFVLNSTDEKGNTKHALIDFELFDDANRTFYKTHQSIKSALSEGEHDLAKSLINDLMTSFYKRFNTLVKRQSNTDSKL